MTQNRFGKAPILSASQMKAWEAQTLQSGQETYESLMEQAGETVIREILKSFSKVRVLVLCGPGNNGGDGFVVARKLKGLGWDVVVACEDSKPDSLSAEAHLNREKWQGRTLHLEAFVFSGYDLVIDALFGTGLGRNLKGIYSEIVQNLSKTEIPCISVDIPSGINSDTGEMMGCAVQASKTITFGSLKRGHVLLPGKMYCGDIKIVDIYLDREPRLEGPVLYENAPTLWRKHFPFPKLSDHKYARGHLLIVGGKNMTGAAKLAAQSSRRIGAGMVTIVCPKSVKDLYAASSLGGLVKSYKDSDDFKKIVDSDKVHGILIGPGLEPDSKTRNLVELCLKTEKPVVIDAGGLSCFKKDKERFFSLLHDKCILLPHEGEFERLFSRSTCKITSTLEAAKKVGTTVLLKGADTVIATPEGECRVNTNAPPFLATAGTGDVLAGMVAGLMIQGCMPFESASAAAWIHGEAANKIGLGLIAEDIERAIPDVLKGLASL